MFRSRRYIRPTGHSRYGNFDLISQWLIRKVRTGALGFAMLFTMALTSQAAIPLQGDLISNVATLNSSMPSVSSSVDVVAIVPTAATITFMQLTTDPAAPALPGVDFSTTSPPTLSPVSSWSPLTPTTPGTWNPTTYYLEGDLVVIELADADRNLDPTAIDNATLQLMVTTSGDTEWLRLYETGPNTGIFVGYVYSGNAPAAITDGFLSAPAGETISVSYDDNGLTLSQSVPVVEATTPADLWLQLEADHQLVAPGDPLGYTLMIENRNTTAPATNITLSQTLPVGFRYREGTAKLDGVSISDPTISSDGRTLTFSIAYLPAGSTSEITFLTLIGAVGSGEYPSSAVAQALGISVSNTARDTVFIRDPFGADRSYLAGRVLLVESCSDLSSAREIDGIRLFLEDGTYVITDDHGRYHIEGIAAGTHVIQLDPTTYPEGTQPALCEDHTRSAGNAASRFVELQPGSLWRADFYLSVIPDNGEVSIALNNTLAIGEAATYSVSLSGRDLVVRNQRLEIELPAEAEFLPGSATLNGTSINDPDTDGRVLSFSLPEQQGAWESTLTLRTLIDENTDTGEMLAGARLYFDTLSSSGLVTPTAESALIWISRGERREVQELLLQPKFDTLNAKLSASDLDILQDTINQLKLLDLIKIYVIGHTDARRIRWSEGVAYRDNFELSEARADVVARELLEQLDLDPEQVVTVGLGAADPISLETTDEGLAQNRRTDLRVLHRVVINPEMDKIKAEGGLVRSLKAERKKEAPQPEKTSLPVGILSFENGDSLADTIHAVRVRLPENLKVNLYLNEVLLPAGQIGFRMSEPENKTVLYSYIGVKFEEVGEHKLKLQGIGPFGNIRYEDIISITRTGEIQDIHVLKTDKNIADGRTPIRVQLELIDKQGQPIRAKSNVEIRAGKLIPLSARDAHLPKSPEERMAIVSRDGWTSFEPVDRSGLYNVTLGYGDAEVDLEIYVEPEQREWILVGLASGTAGTSDILDGVEPLPDGTEDGYYDEGRLAFFARGQVKGDWLLTMAYDSDKEDRRNQSLHQVIDPDSYYTLYGDTTEQGYAAASAEKLYVRVERKRFYAMFGDVDTGLNVTELSRYSRSMTGFKSEYFGRHAGYNLFVSETEQSYVRDEIPGDGTSGLYHLSRTPLVINSDKVTIETRDRYHSETVLETRTLQRHLDYNIDYTTGGIYFKEPIASRDGNFNPITIVVEYETHDRDTSDLTYGGRGYIKAFDDTLEVGASSIHEGADTIESDLHGVDARLDLGESFTLRGEWATSETETLTTTSDGEAWLTEAVYTSSGSNARIYAREQQGAFGLGQQARSENGTRKFGGDFSLRLTQPLSINGEVFTQENLASSTERLVAEGNVEYKQRNYSVTAGIRHANDKSVGNSDETSNQGLVGGEWRVYDRMTLSARHEQSLGDNDNRDYPTRSLLGVDYDLTRKVTLFAHQEFTQGESADTEGTRIGLKAIPWNGAQVHTSVEQQLNENGERSFANLGLTQGWKITPKLSADVSVDRSQILSGDVTTSIHPDQRPAAGTTEEFTAVSSGISYDESYWSFDSRAEFRDGETEDRWGAFAGSIVEPKKDLGLSFSGRFARSDYDDNSWSHDTELRFGLAHRPSHRSWLLLDRLDLIHDAVDDGNGEDEGWRIVNRFNSHWRANRETHIAINTGIRYVAEQIDGNDLDSLTTLLGTEIRYDFTPRWDLGLHLSSLNAWETEQTNYRTGLSVGYSPARNLWLSIGYNLTGFRDKDFSAADYTAQGAFVRFRVKFDQQSVRDAVELFTK